MLPEMAVTLSEVVFEGEIRLGIEVTADYPFLGNATVRSCVYLSESPPHSAYQHASL